jgi:hypothetical protein
MRNLAESQRGSRWLGFEAATRSWWRCLAQLGAWAAAIVVALREGALAQLTLGVERGPTIGLAVGMLLLAGLFIASWRGRLSRQALFLPALLPILVGVALAFTREAPALGDTFASQYEALTLHQALRRVLLSNGLRGTALLLSLALTAQAWSRPTHARADALSVAFGLRASVVLIALTIIAAWKPGSGGVDAAPVLAALLLGVVALAELVSARGYEPAVTFGVALAAAVLAASAGVVDDSRVLHAAPGATTMEVFAFVVRYLPAALLAFFLTFRQRLDAQRALAALLIAAGLPLLSASLAVRTAVRAGEWARSPNTRWLQFFPSDFQPLDGPAVLPKQERLASVLLIGERSLSRGDVALGPASTLDTAAQCDELVSRLKLTPSLPLVFAADRRVPFERLDCLLGAVARSVRARADELGAAGVKALCKAREIRVSSGEAGTQPGRAEVALHGEGCPTSAVGMAVLTSSKGFTTLPPPVTWSVDATKELPRESCPLTDSTFDPTRIHALPVGMSRKVNDLTGHRLLGCGFVPSVTPPSEKPAASTPPTLPFERLSVSGRVASDESNRELKAELYGAVRRCYAPRESWPKAAARAWLAADASDSAAPETWQMATSVQDEGADRCMRAWALELAARSKAGPPLLAEYSVATVKLSLMLTTTDVEGEAWVPQVVEDRRAAMLGCYEPALRADPELSGKLLILLDLDPRHRVLAVRSRQPRALDRLIYCIAPLLQGLEAKPPPGVENPRAATFNVEMRWD